MSPRPPGTPAPAPASGTRSSLWSRPGLLPLVGAEAISNVGTEITAIALPLIAITALDASDVWVAAMTAAGFVGALLFTLPVGIVADRFDRKRLMIAADLASAGVIVAVPLLGFADLLSIKYVLLVTLVIGFLATLHDVCSETVMPEIVEDEVLDDANGALNTIRSTSEVSGPGIGGVLISWVGAPAALLVDAVSFVVSALLLRKVPMAGREPVRRSRATARETLHELTAGVAVYRSDTRLLRLLATSATSNFFSTMAATVEILYLVRVLDVPAWGVGAAFTITAVGGLVGGVILGPLRRRVGPIRVILVSQLVLAAPILLVPLAQQGVQVTFYLVGWFFYSLSSVVYASAVVTYRQRTVPRDVLGRVGATGRWVGGISATLGAALGAALLAAWDIRTIVLLSSVGIYGSAVWLISRWFLSDADRSSTRVSPAG